MLATRRSMSTDSYVSHGIADQGVSAAHDGRGRLQRFAEGLHLLELLAVLPHPDLQVVHDELQQNGADLHSVQSALSAPVQPCLWERSGPQSRLQSIDRPLVTGSSTKHALTLCALGQGRAVESSSRARCADFLNQLWKFAEVPFARWPAKACALVRRSSFIFLTFLSNSLRSCGRAGPP